MLANTVGITAAASIGGGQYTFNMFFQTTSNAKFLRTGDTVQDASGNQYAVLSWATQPTDFSTGGTITAQFITSDVIPGNDAGFFSSVFTPGQVDVRPDVRTSGNIFNITFLSGQDLTYQVSANWTTPSEAAKAAVGDMIVDPTGKEYEITSFTGVQFDDPIVVKEVEAEGQTPASGASTLYRPTPNSSFFQGTEISDPARTVIFNRDKFLIDQLFDSISSQAINADYLNNTGTTLQALDVVLQDASGNMTLVTDLTSDGEIGNLLGLLDKGTSNGLEGAVTFKGLIKNITSAFVLGDVLYLDTDGSLTTTVPEIGAGTFLAGHHIVKIGQITKNASNPANKDFFVEMVWEGTL